MAASTSRYALTAEDKASIASAFPSSFEPAYFTVPPPDDDPSLQLRIHYLHHRGSVAGGAGGSAPRKAILFLHGHPQNRLIWHRVAKQLLASGSAPGSWDMVVPDLRGRGESDAPAVTAGAEASRADGTALRYTKRAMARDVVLLMRSLGYESFYLVGHDRGGRVAHRLLADYPDAVPRAIILDIAPTLDMYGTANAAFAKAYWHWFFLLQPQPYVEDFIAAAPETYLDVCVSRFAPPATSAHDGEETFPRWIMASYAEGLRGYARAHACIEDYRASGPGAPDLVLDEQDRKDGKRIATPVRVIWGKKGLIEMAYKGGVEFWKKTMDNVDGYSVDCGHYIPEEAPAEVVRAINEFFSQ